MLREKYKCTDQPMVDENRLNAHFTELWQIDIARRCTYMLMRNYLPSLTISPGVSTVGGACMVMPLRLFLLQLSGYNRLSAYLG